MLELGVFCGKYLTDCRDEFPASWFARAKLSPSGRDCALNYFGVDASQPLSEWRRKGWVHSDDPRGWFQWYCRYYMGRRLPDEDARHARQQDRFDAGEMPPHRVPRSGPVARSERLEDVPVLGERRPLARGEPGVEVQATEERREH